MTWFSFIVEERTHTRTEYEVRVRAESETNARRGIIANWETAVRRDAVIRRPPETRLIDVEIRSLNTSWEEP